MSRGKRQGIDSTRVALLGALVQAGGEVRSVSGRGVQALAKLAQRDHISTTGLRGQLVKLEAEGAIERDTRHSTTYRVALVRVPDRDQADVDAWVAQHYQRNGKATAPVETPPPVSAPNAAAVADALLAQVLDIASRPDQLTQAQRRLSDSLQDADGLRARLRLAEGELVAVKSERDGLRKRLRIAEDNAKAALTDNTRVVDAEVTKRLATFMAAKPEPSRLARKESDND